MSGPEHRKEKRQVPRFIIPPGQFWIHSMDLVLATSDVSIGGAALRVIDRKALEKFAVGQTLTGELRALGQKFAASLIIRHIRGLTLGCAWVSPTENLNQFLDSHLSPRALGSSLKVFDMPEIALMKWWHAPLGGDLMFYYHQDESKPYLWAMFIHGSVVQWEMNEGLRTGRTVAEDDDTHSAQVVRLETRMVEFDEVVDTAMIQSALEFLSGAESQDQKIDASLLQILKSTLTV